MPSMPRMFWILNSSLLSKASLLTPKIRPSTIASIQVCCLRFTVWKFQDFSAIQILCEINFGESRSSKTAILAILEALKMVHLANFSIQKVKKNA